MVHAGELESPPCSVGGCRSVHLSYAREKRPCGSTALNRPLAAVMRVLVTPKGLIRGGGDRNRTDNHLLAKQVLSQLSYTPT